MHDGTGPNRELIAASAAFSGAFTRWIATLASDGLTYPRLRALEELHCRGPARLGDLAELLDLSARNVTALADGLEADGLARRAPDPTDRRATLLELTVRGTAAAEESLAPRLAAMGRMFDRLSDRDKRTLHRILTDLVHAMSA